MVMEVKNVEALLTIFLVSLVLLREGQSSWRLLLVRCVGCVGGNEMNCESENREQEVVNPRDRAPFFSAFYFVTCRERSAMKEAVKRPRVCNGHTAIKQTIKKVQQRRKKNKKRQEELITFCLNSKMMRKMMMMKRRNLSLRLLSWRCCCCCE